MTKPREQFHYEIDNELERHEEYNGKIKKDLKSMKVHGGLGMDFVRKFKIIIAIFTVFLLIAGVVIFRMIPALRGAYSVSVLGSALLASVFYLRKVQDNNME